MAEPSLHKQKKRRLGNWTIVAVVPLLAIGAHSLRSCSMPAGLSSLWAAEPLPTATTVFPASETFISVAKQAKASVVNVSSTRKVVEGKRFFESPSPFDDPFFRRFFGEEFERRFRQPKEFRQEGMGSGVIVREDGYIVTNNHVIEQAGDIEVSLADKRKFKAKVVGTDPKTDLAVLKIEASGLPKLPWADSAGLEVGEMVLAVGNPFGLTQTVTMGIVSAVGRANVGIVDYEDFIQTDAAINPGNSGGALVNLKGELIGINTAIFTRTGGYMGIGFAIPSNMVKTVMDSLIKHGKVVRGWLGVSIQEVTPDLAKEFGVSDTKGALISDVLEDSPASRAGFERGDVIIEYDGKPVTDPTRLRSLVADSAPGTRVTITIARDRQKKALEVTLGELPKDLTAFRATGEAKGDHALTGVDVRPLAGDDTRERGFKHGVVVRRVDPDSPAARAGLQTDDVIREMNRKPIRSIEDFQQIVRKLGPRDKVLLLVSRETATIFLVIAP
ncbi:DegQ family serine endoprotease [Petrachloros mirabilis]